MYAKLDKLRDALEKARARRDVAEKRYSVWRRN